MFYFQNTVNKEEQIMAGPAFVSMPLRGRKRFLNVIQCIKSFKTE